MSLESDALRAAQLVAVLVLFVAGGACAESVAPQTLKLAAGDSFSLSFEMDTEQLIEHDGVHLKSKAVIVEDYHFEVAELETNGSMNIGVTIARSHGLWNLPMQELLEFDSDIERTSLEKDPMAAMLMVLVGLKFNARVSADGTSIELPGATEALDSHFKTQFAEAPKPVLEAIIENFTAKDLEARLRMIFQTFSASGVMRWPFELLVPATSRDKQFRIKGEHKLEESTDDEFLWINHSGELKVGADNEDTSITQSAVSGRTRVDRKSGRVLEREINASCTMRITKSEMLINIDQTMIFRVEPLEAAEKSPADSERRTIVVIQTLADACRLYQMDNGHLPESLEELIKDPPYVDGIPTDGYGHAIIYSIAEGELELISPGADGKLGTEDDISLER